MPIIINAPKAKSSGNGKYRRDQADDVENRHQEVVAVVIALISIAAVATMMTRIILQMQPARI